MRYLKSYKEINEKYLDTAGKECEFQAGDKVTVDNVEGVGVVDWIELDTENGKNDTYAVVRYDQNGRKFTSTALISKLKHAD